MRHMNLDLPARYRSEAFADDLTALPPGRLVPSTSSPAWKLLCVLPLATGLLTIAFLVSGTAT
jgi:hypothetical protein